MIPRPLNKKKKIGIIGIAGRMGRAIESLLRGHPLFECVMGFDRAPSLKGARDLCDVFQGSDYVCDFSHADLCADIVQAAKKCPKPLLMGSTGHQSLHHDIKDIVGMVPVIVAPNTSIGAVVQRWISGYIAPRLNAFHVDIVEAHHSQKADQPSGTAQTLATHIADTLVQKGRAVDVQTQTASPRSHDSIVIHTQRRGCIPAESTVIWTSNAEELSIRHSAFGQQDTFARGALSVFEWMHCTEPGPGLYTMEDVLGLTSL